MLATSQPTVVGAHTKAVISKALASGHSQQFVLEIMNKTYEEMQGAKSSAIPVLYIWESDTLDIHMDIHDIQSSDFLWISNTSYGYPWISIWISMCISILIFE